MADKVTIHDILRRRHEAEVRSRARKRKYWLFLLPVTAAETVLKRIAQVLLALFILFLHPLIGWTKETIRNSALVQRVLKPWIGRYYHLYFHSLERLPPVWATLSIAVPLAVLEPAKMWATVLCATNTKVGVPMWIGLQAVSFVLIEKTWEHVRHQARKIGLVRLAHDFLVLNIEYGKKLIKNSAVYRGALRMRKAIQFSVSVFIRRFRKQRAAAPLPPAGEAAKPWFSVCGCFDEDYLALQNPAETGARCDREARLIWRLLELKAGERLFDIACGTGRITQRLAARGAHVAGLERSAAFLALAEEAARLQNVRVNYMSGDIVHLPVQPQKSRADAVLVPLAAFEHGDDGLGLLQACARVLKPGGRILIDQPNSNYLHRTGGPHDWALRPGNGMVAGQCRYDALTGRVTTRRTVVRGGKTSVTTTSVRLYPAAELTALLKQAGYVSISAYNGDGEPLTRFDPRQIVVARRPEAAPAPGKKGRAKK